MAIGKRLTGSEKVRQLQTVLHAKAKDEPGRRFCGVHERQDVQPGRVRLHGPPCPRQGCVGVCRNEERQGVTGQRWSAAHDPEMSRAKDDRDETLERLVAMLHDLGEAMTAGEMDGFVTGLLAVEELVPPSDWLPVVWRPDTEFDSIEAAEATAAALVGHYNGVAGTLAYEPENYGPVLEVAGLKALRGVDVITAMTVLAELGDLTRFDSPRRLMSFLGLVPSKHSSGGHRRQGGIVKTDNGHARRVLVEATWSCCFAVYLVSGWSVYFDGLVRGFRTLFRFCRAVPRCREEAFALQDQQTGHLFRGHVPRDGFGLLRRCARSGRRLPCRAGCCATNRSPAIGKSTSTSVC